MGKRIIEFIGPPGIGKTSIYKNLCLEWNKKCSWIYQDMLLAPKKPSLSNFTSWLIYNGQLLLGRKLVKAIPDEYALRFIHHHQELAGFCWDHLSDPAFFDAQAQDRRFRAAYYLFGDFSRYQAIEEAPDQRPCLIDEGLLQKSFLIHDDEQLMRDLLHRYVSLAPLPYAIIYIDTPDQQVIAQRLQSRRKKLPAHLGKNNEALLAETEKWQYLLGMILEMAENQKVIIYQVDGAKPVKENVRLIQDFLANLP